MVADTGGRISNKKLKGGGPGCAGVQQVTHACKEAGLTLGDFKTVFDLKVKENPI
jgi:hypothetical protein